MENVLTLIFTALVVPFLTAFFNKENWSGDKKFIVTIVVTVIFGSITQFAAIKAGWQAQDANAIFAALGLVFTGAQGFYRLFPNAITSVEKNVNGVPPKMPDAGDLVKTAIAAATPLIIDQIEKKFGEKVKSTAPSMAGIAGAVPSEPQAQLGGPDIPVNPLSETLYTKHSTPLITPAPTAKAEAAAIAAAISAGIPVESIADNVETPSPGGSE